MKDAFVWTISSIVRATKRISFLRLAVILCILIFSLNGCTRSVNQPGETLTEGHRRHRRNITVNQQNLMSDIDRALLFDEPSKLADRKIPAEISD